MVSKRVGFHYSQTGYDGAANMSGQYKGLQPGERVIQLQKLSDTRWACREKALKALNKVMDAVVKVLTDLTVQEPPDTAAGDARMYLNAIDFEFLLCLAIATPVFDVTALASDALQNEGIARHIVLLEE